VSARAVQRVLFFVGFAGLCLGFIAQWLIFEPGHFSPTSGPVYIPLGEHGIYTSKALGFTWYLGVALFVICDAVGLIWRTIDRRKSP
jgi:hypothetical protein